VAKKDAGTGECPRLLLAIRTVLISAFAALLVGQDNILSFERCGQCAAGDGFESCLSFAVSDRFRDRGRIHFAGNDVIRQDSGQLLFIFGF